MTFAVLSLSYQLVPAIGHLLFPWLNGTVLIILYRVLREPIFPFTWL